MCSDEIRAVLSSDRGRRFWDSLPLGERCSLVELAQAVGVQAVVDRIERLAALYELSPGDRGEKYIRQYFETPQAPW